MELLQRLALNNPHAIKMVAYQELGLSELKYYIVELMKDQNEIRQIVKDFRELLEKGEEN